MPGGGTGSGGGGSGSNGSGSGSDGGGTSTGDPNPFPSDPAGGEFAWVVSSPGAVGSTPVAVDRDGNIVVATTQTDEVTLGSLHLAAPAGQALLVLQLTGDGKPVWGRSFPLAGSVEANAITVTSEGDVVIGGQFSGGPLQVGDQQMTSAGNGDGFVIALDGTSGVPRWAAQLGSANDHDRADHVAGLVAGPDADGVEAIFAYGWLGSDVLFGQSSYLIRYNRDGTQRWARSFVDLDSIDSSLTDAHSLALDPQRGPVISGFAGSGLMLGDHSVSGPILAGFDFDGQVRFARMIVSDGQSIEGKLGVGPGGDVYLATRFHGTPVLVDDSDLFVLQVDLASSGSGSNSFLLRFTPEGSVAFSRTIRTTSTASPVAMVTDPAGASYVASRCLGEVDVQPEIQCDPKLGAGLFIASYDADNTYRWATYVQQVDADLAAAPGGRLVMAGLTLGPEVNFGGIRVPTQTLFIAALGAGPARLPSPLPAAPTISRVTLDGAPDLQIRQGGAGTLVITGTALDQVTTARLGEMDIHVPAHAATATELRLPVTIPHGHAAGPLTLTLGNAGGSAQESFAVTVTPIVVGPTRSDTGRGTFSSPVGLCGAVVQDTVNGDVIQLLDGTHGCGSAGFVGFLHTGLTIRGQSQAGTVIRGTTILLDPELFSRDPFGTVTIENLTIQDAGIRKSGGNKLIVTDVTMRDTSGGSRFIGAIGALGELVAANIDITGFGGGIGINGTATVNHFRYHGGGVALAVGSGQVVARDVVVDQAGVGVVVDSGSLDLADSNISSDEAAINAGDINTQPGTRTVTIANTILRSTRVAITEATTQLTLTDCTLERGPGEVGRFADGIDAFGGTLALTRTVLRGFEGFGFALWDTPFSPFVPFVPPNLTLDQVDIDVGDTGIEEIVDQIQGHLSIRNSHVTGQRNGLSLLGGFATVDLGTADSPGNNLVETAAGGVAFEDWGDDGAIDLHGTSLNGTSFDGQVQGPASAAGAYTLHGADTIRF